MSIVAILSRSFVIFWSSKVYLHAWIFLKLHFHLFIINCPLNYLCKLVFVLVCYFIGLISKLENQAFSTLELYPFIWINFLVLPCPIEILYWFYTLSDPLCHCFWITLFNFISNWFIFLRKFIAICVWNNWLV